MIKKKNKYIILILFFLVTCNHFVLANINTNIIFKLNEKIITNIDINNEKKFLIFLNPNLNNLSDIQINNISEKSLKNRLIKQIELERFYNFKKITNGDEYVERFVSNNNFNDIANLKNQLKNIKLDYEYFRHSFLIDNVWREFIYNKFNSQVKIDVDKLKKQIKTQETEIDELNLSEIVFELKTNLKIDELVKDIYETIENSGFDVAASLYSISESKNFGGKLGWIKSNQISKEIYSEIQDKEISKPIKTGNGYLILKINDRRKAKQEINFDNELQKLINFESDKELNKLGYIYFNKIKKRIFIIENR